MSKIEPNFGYGAPRGWKAKQEAAKRKMSGGKNSAERERVREIRKRHREALERGEVPQPESTPEEKAVEATVQVAESEPIEPEATEADSGPVEGDSLPDPEDMDRDALVEELKAAGERVHPASKDSTLRDKVRGLR